MQVHDLFKSAEFQPDKMKKKNLFSSPRMFFDIYCLEPSQQQALHRHDNNDKIYLVVDGEVEVMLGSEKQILHPNQAVVASAGIPHGILNRSASRAVVAVMMAPHPAFEK